LVLKVSLGLAIWLLLQYIYRRNKVIYGGEMEGWHEVVKLIGTIVLIFAVGGFLVPKGMEGFT